jgi:nicotinate-nucleotide pyrophosphorylase (carboxylating)
LASQLPQILNGKIMKDLTSIPYIDLSEIEALIARALEEDLGEKGDITTNSVVPEGLAAKASLIAKADGVLAGLPLFEMVFKAVDAKCQLQFRFSDGEKVCKKDLVATVEGPARSLLIAERTGLNLLCRLSGIATLTDQYVEAVRGTEAVVLDTRKTIPGLRTLEKYAVYCGGGANHRIGLFDAVLIKENHIAMGGGITKAVTSARAATDVAIQVEVETLEQLREAIAAGADSVLLDNMTPEMTSKAVNIIKAEAPAEFLSESSGGITLQTIGDYARTGVNRISTGAITHSAKALDLSLEIQPLI